MATPKPARVKRAKWDVAVVGGVPQATGADGKPDRSAIQRAQLGASAVLQKINQVGRCPRAACYPGVTSAGSASWEIGQPCCRGQGPCTAGRRPGSALHPARCCPGSGGPRPGQPGAGPLPGQGQRRRGHHLPRGDHQRRSAQPAAPPDQALHARRRQQAHQGQHRCARALHAARQPGGRGEAPLPQVHARPEPPGGAPTPAVQVSCASVDSFGSATPA